jgi:enoyl-CoA hydratase/carnithine racemase
MLIESAVKDQIKFIYINRMEKRNALTKEMVQEMDSIVNGADDDPEVRSVAITGKGNDFSVGADIAMLSSFSVKEAKEFRKMMNQLARRIRECSRPVIAILKGYSLGGGLELAESADIRIAIKGAVIGQPEASIGINAGSGGNVMLPRIIGRGNAMYLSMMGKRISAEEAKTMGLVNEIVDDEEEAESIIKLINKQPLETLQYIKKAVNASYDLPIEEAMNLEALYFSLLFTEEETRHALSSWKKYDDRSD